MALVITHYDKNYDWAKSLAKQNSLELYIYDKTNITNLGRESYSIFHYIIENYEKLPEIVIFFQDGINGINENIKKNHPILPFEYYINCSSTSMIGHLRTIDQKDNWKGCGQSNPSYPSLLDFKQFLGVNKNEMIDKYFRCSNFAIGRDVILLHTKEYYMNILCNTNLNKVLNPSEAYFVELLNANIFLNNKNTKELVDEQLHTRQFKGKDKFDNNLSYGFELI